METISIVDSSEKRLGLGSVPLVDLRFLSRSELSSLSLCRDDGFDLRHLDDVVAPAIDRSIFNESAGSRKQTFSRRRSAAELQHSSADPTADSEVRETELVVRFIRGLCSTRQNPSPILALAPAPATVPETKQRRRGRREEPDAENTAIVVYKNEYEVLNRSGEVVDVARLAEQEDPFGPDLRRRTVGMETEAELLDFLNELEGQWGSGGKKRKIVDAGEFGDVLPVGWKLLLSLRWREGRVSLICRRYISPNGQQFLSCKEVSSYLLPFIQPQEVSQPIASHIYESTNRTCNVATKRTAGPINNNCIAMEVPICYSATPISSISTDHEKQMVVFRVENPVKAQLRNLLECRKCKMIFGDKDAYMQHMFSFHKRNSKRCRLGKSIADGVIIKDGKFECQFCHKAFDEKRRYNSHVGIHVREYDKSLKSLPDEIIVQTCIEPSSLLLVPLAISAMNGLDGIGSAANIMPSTSMAKSRNGTDLGSANVKQDTKNAKIGVTSQSFDETDDGCEMIGEKLEKVVETNNSMDDKLDDKLDNCMDDGTLISSEGANVICHASHEKVSSSSMLDENIKSGNEKEKVNDRYSDELTHNEPPNIALNESEKSTIELDSAVESCSITLSNNEQTCGMDTSTDEISNSGMKEVELNNMEKFGIDRGNELGSRYSESGKDMVVEITGSTGEETVLQNMASDMPLLIQSSGCFPCIEMISDKGEFSSVNQKPDNISDFKEQGLDNIEQPEFGFATGQDSRTMPEEPMELSYGAELELGLNTLPEGPMDLACGVELDQGEFSSVNQKPDNISDFKEIGLNNIEHPEFGFATGQDSRTMPLEPMDLSYGAELELGLNTLPEGPMDLAYGVELDQGPSTLPPAPMDLVYGAELEPGLVPSVSFEWDTVSQFSPKMESRNQLTSICVWCRREFNHERTNAEMQSNSVGSMCPTCKDKISAQLNELENGLSMNYNQF